MAFDVDQWCRNHLGSAVEETLFTSGHLSRVLGVRLTGGRAVIVKVRPFSPRLAACIAVERALCVPVSPPPNH